MSFSNNFEMNLEESSANYHFSFRRTSGALTTTPARTPKPPSEIVGKTVEEVILALTSFFPRASF